MRWRGRRRSTNIEDLRGGGGRRRLPGRRVSLGGGGILGLVLVLVYVLLGGDPAVFLQQPGGAPPAPMEAPLEVDKDDPMLDFVRVVLADTEEVWKELFDRHVEGDYKPAILSPFHGRVESACGFATAAVGPFYCPADQHVYLDFRFFQQLRDDLGAPGDFAMAYVIAHEVAHHVQNLLGQMQQVHNRQRRVGKVESNRLSVRLELQADYLAGVWARHAEQMFKILEPGDIQEALQAANSIGDDRLQKSAQGYIVPDSFTHGTSEQRLKWFTLGLKTGDLAGMKQLFELPYESL